MTLQSRLVAYQLKGSYGTSRERIARLEADVRDRQPVAGASHAIAVTKATAASVPPNISMNDPIRAVIRARRDQGAENSSERLRAQAEPGTPKTAANKMNPGPYSKTPALFQGSKA